MTATFSNFVNGSSTSSITSISVTMPAASAGNLIAVVMSINTGSSNTMSPPDGTWTSILRVSHSGNDISQELWIRVATGSESASYNWTFGSASTGTAWQAWTISGQDATTYSDQTPSSNQGASTAPQATSITTTVADCLGVALYGAGTGTYTPSQPTGWTTLGGDATGRGWGIYYKTIATATSIGNVDSTLGASRNWTAMLWAIRPTGSTPAGQPTSARLQNIPYSGARIQRRGV